MVVSRVRSFHRAQIFLKIQVYKNQYAARGGIERVSKKKVISTYKLYQNIEDLVMVCSQAPSTALDIYYFVHSIGIRTYNIIYYDVDNDHYYIFVLTISYHFTYNRYYFYLQGNWYRFCKYRCIYYAGKINIISRGILEAEKAVDDIEF